MTLFEREDVAAAFAAMAAEPRAGCLLLRQLVFDTASGLPKAHPLEETLKWGQPAYLAPKGSTIRVGPLKTEGFGLFVHCQSRLIPDYLEVFPDMDLIDGTRAILFDTPSQISPERHGWLISRALTYHIR